MIAVSVADQNDVHSAEPRIARRHGRPGIVENPHTGRIFEQDRAIERRQFACGLTEGSELHRLRVCGAGAAREAEACCDPPRQTHSHECLLPLMADGSWPDCARAV